MTELLPVGSVVKIDEDKPFSLMVIGYYPVDMNTSTCYQYAGVIYPRGLTESGRIMMFNHKDIAKVLFEGFATEESKEAIKGISASVEADDSQTS